MITKFLINNMHLIYRSKKQTPLPLNTLANYMPSPHPHLQTHLLQKNNIESHIQHNEKHVPFVHSNPALVYNKQLRKTLYRPSRARKAESGYFKGYIKSPQWNEETQLTKRNKSMQMVERENTLRRRGSSEYSPYILGQKKTRSSSKFADIQAQKDWICQRLIQREVYALEEGSDFI